MTDTQPTPWLSPDEQQVWRDLLRMHSELAAVLGRQLGERGLSMADYAVLVTLSEAPENRLRVSDLAAALIWERSRLSHQLRRMTERELVCRQECPTDGRVGYAVLTDAGKAAVQASAPGHAHAVRELVFSDLSADDLRTVGRFLTATLARLDATTQRPPTQNQET